MTVFSSKLPGFNTRLTSPLKIVLPYLLLGVLYIFFSDRIVQFFFKGEDILTEIQTYKGITYVAVTGILLYFIISKYAGQIAETFIHRQQKERFFDALIEHSLDMKVVTNGAGDVIFIGQNIINLLGYKHQEFKSFNIFQLIHPDDLNDIKATIAQIVNSPGIVAATEARILHKDGHYEWMESNIVNKLDTPEINGAIINAQTVSAKKQTEMQLAYKNRELDTFIYRSSHDLRGPIMTMLGLTNVAISESNDRDVNEYMTHFHSVAEKMKDSLDNLMAITKIKQSKTNITKCSPKRTIENILLTGKLSHHLQKANLQCEVEDFQLLTDEYLLEIIFSQVLDNALKFRTNTQQHEVSVQVSSCNGSLRTVITDNGLGVANPDKENIFDLYYRGRNCMAGNGIGLYIVKSAIDKLGGTISINSNEMMGTTVTIEIPESVPEKAEYTI